MDGVRYEVVDESVYLRTLVTCNNDVSREIKRRVAAANRTFYGMRSQLKSRNLQTRTKLVLYKSLILPVALYGHEAWTLKETDYRVLGVFESKILRSILSGKMVKGEWRRRMYHELYQVYKHADIGRLIKHGRLQWAGHVARMPEERLAKVIFTREPGRGRRYQGRPRTRWICESRRTRVRRACRETGDWRPKIEQPGNPGHGPEPGYKATVSISKSLSTFKIAPKRTGGSFCHSSINLNNSQ